MGNDVPKLRCRIKFGAGQFKFGLPVAKFVQFLNRNDQKRLKLNPNFAAGIR